MPNTQEIKFPTVGRSCTSFVSKQTEQVRDTKKLEGTKILSDLEDIKRKFSRIQDNLMVVYFALSPRLRECSPVRLISHMCKWF